jgi:hypothetical protein
MTYRTATFKFNATLAKEITKIFISEVDPIRIGKGMMIGASLPLMIIDKDEISHFSTNGGNALGIEADDGPLLRKPFFRLND